MATLDELRGTRWSGTYELWLDPLGDNVESCDCTVAIEEGALRYTWSREGKQHEGSVTWEGGEEARFTDSWHQPEPLACLPVSTRALLSVQGAYGPDSDWGWRITVCFRAPTEQLVVQMTNVAPWGEEVRAVRMTCRRGG